ncbi:glycine/betaine ABC transporter permease [Paractinoplanes abujensis]|uniref:Osmoprotectant transport system permease protein n=1 Tax=Paractinoplanes abujensis TaxID=882441 RepID=A0A7W7CPB6_9ACTN|nr:ABC transporter permease subunit [Actinoplanes abujensis]MBB4692237.1 osmoprotectant transport system permease protein [Actinoplanes abujensis]GID24283.1 glycine/betaine ABC transporter permease [Actinoplanes abujensis]
MNLTYLFDAAHWDFSSGSIPQLIVSHLWYVLLALALGTVIALPVGLYIGHTGRGSFIAINAGNAGRSLPTLGLLMLMVTLLGLGLLPVLIALTVLVIPPILTSAYAGIRSLDPGVVDAARGVGMRPLQVLFRVELPMALPVLMSGFRSAALQVVATATVAAAVGLGGLGRLLIDGLAVNDYSRVLAGAIVVAVLAVLLDLVLAFAQRWIVSPGLRASK